MKKILILEDEKEIAAFYAKFLNGKGYETLVASSGVEGLEFLKKFTPDLIMLDLNMPQMGGVEFYQYVCGSRAKAPYPIMVVTGRGDMESLFRDFNVDGFIVKPFGSDRLLKEIEIILGKYYDPKRDPARKRVIIVDEDAIDLEKISAVFSKAGYRVETCSNGTDAVHKIMEDPPDLALINLSLADISGDLVVFRLQQIVKTKSVHCLLYLKKDADHIKIVMDKIGTKKGVASLCEYNDPQELLQAAEKSLQTKSSDE